jgi:hypothetical protein
MSWQLQLDQTPYSFTLEDLPSLIHGEKGSGASLLSLALAAELYKQGHPLLIIAQSDDAREEFLKQTKSDDHLFTIKNESDLLDAEKNQVLFLHHKDIILLPMLLNLLPEKEERVLLLKNFEDISDNVVTSLSEHRHIIYTGDLNLSSSKEYFLQLKYSSKIFFSPLRHDIRLTLPDLEKYQAYFLGRIAQGKITLKTIHEQP